MHSTRENAGKSGGLGQLRRIRTTRESLSSMTAYQPPKRKPKPKKEKVVDGDDELQFYLELDGDGAFQGLPSVSSELREKPDTLQRASSAILHPDTRNKKTTSRYQSRPRAYTEPFTEAKEERRGKRSECLRRHQRQSMSVAAIQEFYEDQDRVKLMMPAYIDGQWVYNQSQKPSQGNEFGRTFKPGNPSSGVTFSLSQYHVPEALSEQIEIGKQETIEKRQETGGQGSDSDHGESNAYSGSDDEGYHSDIFQMDEDLGIGDEDWGVPARAATKIKVDR